MEKKILNYLASKHVLVASGPSDTAVETLFTLGYRFAVRVTEGREMACVDHIRVLADVIGQFVPEPFYRGFPHTVKQLLGAEQYIDRIYHYASAAGLTSAEVTHHSIFEEEFERADYAEKNEESTFIIIKEEEARTRVFAYLDDALRGTRPLPDATFDVLCTAILTEGYTVGDIPCKDTRIRLLAATRDVAYLKGLTLTDLLKVTEYLQAAATPDCVDMKKLALPARDRRFITSLFDALLDGYGDFTECYEKKKLFCGLLHHIHYHATCETGKAFVSAMRGKENRSVYSRMERLLASGDVKGACDLLLAERGGTAILRHLNLLLSRATSEADMVYVLDRLPDDNPTVYIQLLHEYATRGEEPTARSFVFSRRGLVRTHTETEEEVECRRSFLPKKMAEAVEALLRVRLAGMLRGRLGRVYIDPAMYRIAIPLSEGSSQGGLGVLPKGSRLPLPEGYKVRAFTYWEQVDDVDLSVQGLGRDGGGMEFSWRTFFGEEADALVFSGDQVDGFHGGSEYFDVDLDAFRAAYPTLSHLVFCNAVYSQLPFSRLVCRAGYMLREQEDSGEVFEPKTVKSSFTINCESTEAYLFGIDLDSSEIVWLNLAKESRRRVSGDSTFTFLRRYFDTVSVLSLGDLFALLATEVVKTPEEADVILSDAELPAGLPAECIRSYDTERVTALLA